MAHPDQGLLKRYVDLYIHLYSYVYYFYFINYIYIYIYILLNMKKDANEAPDSFRSFIEKIKMERIRK